MRSNANRHWPRDEVSHAVRFLFHDSRGLGCRETPQSILRQALTISQAQETISLPRVILLSKPD